MPTINCSTCAAKLKLPASVETQTFKCPKCGSLIEADADAKDDAFRRGAPPRFNGSSERDTRETSKRTNVETSSCRYCGEEILRNARKCKHCGEILDPDLRESRREGGGRVVVNQNVSVGGNYRGGYVPEEKSSAVAVLLEVLPGLFFQTFGIGHLYAGNVGAGLGFLFGYWAILAVNVGLMFCFVGFFSWPICWLLFLILSPMLAAQHCNYVNAENAARRRS